jgi:hypothetical protein
MRKRITAVAIALALSSVLLAGCTETPTVPPVATKPSLVAPRFIVSGASAAEVTLSPIDGGRYFPGFSDQVGFVSLGQGQAGWFSFDITQLAGRQVCDLTFSFTQWDTTNPRYFPLTINMYDVSTSHARLIVDRVPIDAEGEAIASDLHTGNVYASFQVSGAGEGTGYEIALNDFGIGDLQAAVGRGEQFFSIGLANVSFDDLGYFTPANASLRASVDCTTEAPSATFVAAPDLDARVLTSTVIEGTSIKLALTSPTPIGGTFQYAFDCGSGYGPFTTRSRTACPTVDNEQRAVRGKIRDTDGGVSEYTKVVSVVNHNPHVVLATAQGATSPLGSPRAVSGTFTDPGVQDAPWSYAITWGDGTSTSGTTSNQPGPIPASHPYTRLGKFSIKMTVTDKDGGTGKSNSVVVQVVPATGGNLIDGVWAGDMVTPPPFNAPRSIRLMLQETNGNVSGSCEIAFPGDPPYYTCTVSGTHTHPAITLTLSSPGFAPISLTGSFTDGSTIAATLNGSGFVDTPVTLKRQ